MATSRIDRMFWNQMERSFNRVAYLKSSCMETSLTLVPIWPLMGKVPIPSTENSIDCLHRLIGEFGLFFEVEIKEK